MTVELFKERDAVVVKWEPGSYEGQVRLKASSPDGDVSETIVESNQGYAALSFPRGEIADFHCEVLSEPDGELIDQGAIEF